MTAMLVTLTDILPGGLMTATLVGEGLLDKTAVYLLVRSASNRYVRLPRDDVVEVYVIHGLLEDGTNTLISEGLSDLRWRLEGCGEGIP